MSVNCVCAYLRTCVSGAVICVYDVRIDTQFTHVSVTINGTDRAADFIDLSTLGGLILDN